MNVDGAAAVLSSQAAAIPGASAIRAGVHTCRTNAPIGVSSNLQAAGICTSTFEIVTETAVPAAAPIMP